ncbi:MAG: Rap1a/Tai family immunity protein [Halieaceae bacterium]
MNFKTWLGSLLLSAAALLALNAQAGDYSLEDFNLNTAEDLLDVCTVKASHADHAVATAFCYGFFEGAHHYDDAIENTTAYVDIVCSPDGTTRTEAVAVFVAYLGANPQYGSEKPVDAAFRALSSKWPCSK